MQRTQRATATLLFFSGACALIYQTTWLRQLRLVFGASTFAIAAVLAIFMAGLGFGSAILGRRADRSANPLALYGVLELSIGVMAGLSQLLLPIVSRLYIATGGSTTLGITGATIVRLLLATLVIGAPTFLMGGTLPAAARAVEEESDIRRRHLAILYATNTLGAVAGAVASTFWMLERLGNRWTLLSAVIVNVGVGAVALLLSRSGEAGRASREEVAQQRVESDAPRSFVLAAAATSGFAFLLMELVWYRTLAPLLGGTTFMFGLVLAVALLGIGAGGALYGAGTTQRKATVGRFALTCTLEAAALMIPYAVGDRLAIATNLVRPLSYAGFAGSVLTWSVVTFAVVFPAAVIAGYQFPLLIALMGEGKEGVGRDVGLAYAWNTAGSIAGSLAGGFGLIPLLSAGGCWIAAALLLTALGGWAIFLAVRKTQHGFALAAALAGVFAVAQTFALGPTAVWMQAGIGAGRATQPKSRNEIAEWVNRTRRTLIWAADGRESNIATLATDDLAFLVNGKADGSARADAGTQVMGGLLGAALHRNPKTALVVGLGTGSTAGWLGAIPSMTRVDVVELEPLVLRVARDFTHVNHDVLHDPKVHIDIADAREVLLASRKQYDVIFSEPSNPWRAGIASLFTREFYESANERLATGGIFVQWVQAYEIDTPTVGTIYKTLTSVFPHVQTWSGESGDLLLVATRQPVVIDVPALRARIATQPYRAAIHDAWRAESLEGFLSHHIANEGLSRAIAANATVMNTDDQPAIEFGFARSLGRSAFAFKDFVALAQKRGVVFPQNVRGSVNWNLVLLYRATDAELELPPPLPVPQYDLHHAFAKLYKAGNLARALELWESNRLQPVNGAEISQLGDALAEAGREEAVIAAGMLRRVNPLEADAIVARLRFQQKRYPESLALMLEALADYRNDPWANDSLTGRLIDAAVRLARVDRRSAPLLYRAMREPFAARQWDDVRKYYALLIAQSIRRCGDEEMESLLESEPSPMWRDNVLAARVRCYAKTPLEESAKRDFGELKAGSQAALVR